jgi:CIC family chloride channel protein
MKQSLCTAWYWVRVYQTYRVELYRTVSRITKADDSTAIVVSADRRGITFWIAVMLTGVGTGVSAGALYLLLNWVQHLAWPGGGSLLDAASHASLARHLMILVGAGLLTGFGQLVLSGLSSGNGIDINAAIWFSAGRLPALRTLGSALLSIVLVGMGVSLGREGAPKQAGAVFGNWLSDAAKLSDEQRRLLVACGAGAGMAAAYGVPLGGALFSLEVLRGLLALRLVLPALLASTIATLVAWSVVPNEPLYVFPAYAMSVSVVIWSLFLGPIAGLVSVGYVRAVRWADSNKPKGLKRVVAPLIVLAALGALSFPFPQILGNGQAVSELAFRGGVGPLMLLGILVLKPIATVMCVRSGVPGGLFTPSLTVGAMLGGCLGYVWSLLWPGAPLGLYSVLGAAAMLAATTQGPISTVVLMFEMTGHNRAFIAPLLLAVITATLVARLIEPRSIYDAKLSDEQVAARIAARAPAPG